MRLADSRATALLLILGAGQTGAEGFTDGHVQPWPRSRAVNALDAAAHAQRDLDQTFDGSVVMPWTPSETSVELPATMAVRTYERPSPFCGDLPPKLADWRCDFRPKALVTELTNVQHVWVGHRGAFAADRMKQGFWNGLQLGGIVGILAAVPVGAALASVPLALLTLFGLPILGALAGVGVGALIAKTTPDEFTRVVRRNVEVSEP